MTLTQTATAPVSSQYKVTHIDTVHAVPSGLWDDTVSRAGGTVFHSWAFLAACEDAPPAQASPRHLLLWSGEDLVGVLPAFLTASCPRLAHLADLAEQPLGGPVLIAHSLAALAGGPLTVAGHDPAIELLLDALEEHAHGLGAWATAVANAPYGPLTGHLLRRGYATAHITTAYHCVTDVPSPDAYWAELRQGRRRRKFAQERRAVERRFHIAEQPVDGDALVALVAELLAFRNTPADVLPAPFLRALKARLAPWERSFTALNDQAETVALFAGWQFNDTWSVWLAGLAAQRINGFEPYRAMAAALLDSAITDGVPRVDLGRGNAAQKRRLGARPTPLHLALKTGTPAEDALLHASFRRLAERCQGDDDQLDLARRCC